MFSNKIMDNSLVTPHADSRIAPVQEGLEKFSKLALALSMSALLAACGSDGDSSSGVVAEGDVIPRMAVNVEKPSLNAGEATDITVRFTDQNNNLITTAIDVSFSSNCLSDDRAIIDGETSTDDGAARITYTAASCTGVDVLQVSATVGEVNLLENAAITIDPDTVAGISASKPAPIQLALRGMGGEEESSVTFTVRGENGAPVEGQTVTFELRPTSGGVSLSASSGETRSDGTVTVKAISGTTSTVFRVLAEHAETGNTAESVDISVSTGVPVQSKFVIALDRFNPPSARRQGQEVTVSVIASDQYGNPATDGTIVNFWAPELGQIDPSCSLTNGRCSVTWVSSGAVPSNGDYRSTIIAFTDGAEDFNDLNGNNVYDGDDTFNVAADDLSEPYTDENENGSYAVGEFFVDFDHNQIRDDGDGVWNGPCLASVDQSALCEGAERVTIADTHIIVNSSDSPQILNTGNFGNPGDTITLAGRTTLSLRISDINGVAPSGNTMPVGTTYTFASTNGTIVSGGTYSVQDNERDGQLLALVIKPDDTPSIDGDLTLTVKPPEGAEVVWSWTLND